MKQIILFVFLFLFFSTTKAQTASSQIEHSNSILKKLVAGDSITYYQCHVEEAIQQITTVSGQTITGTIQKYTVTEKFVIQKNNSTFLVNYYTSSINIFPNRKFSTLKIREKPYWDFRKIKQFELSEEHVKILLALENKGREAIEYDYAISKYTTNQLIIKLKSDFKQLVIDGDFVLSKLLK